MRAVKKRFWRTATDQGKEADVDPRSSTPVPFDIIYNYMV